MIHCDITPYNVLSDQDDFVVGDFDSCTKEGDELGLKAGTIGWTNDEFRIARPENDYYGLSKIEEFLFSQRLRVSNCSIWGISKSLETIVNSSYIHINN